MNISSDAASKVSGGQNRLKGQVKRPVLAKRLRADDSSKVKEKKMREVSRGFEEIFVRQLMEHMRRNVPKSSLFGNGFRHDIYVSMLDAEVAKHIANKDGFGLSNIIYDYIQRVENRRSGEKPADVKQPIPLRPSPTVEPFKLKKPMPLSKSDRVFLRNEPAEGKKTMPLPQEQRVYPKTGTVEGKKPMPLPRKDNVSPKNGAKDKIGKYDSIIEAASRRFGVDPNLIRAVIMKESSGNSNAVSSKGAKGLMQLMEGTASEMGVRDIFDPWENILGGSRYLRTMLDMHEGDVEKALAAYNAGPGNVRRYGGVPPFRETQNYVDSVLALYKQMEDSGKSSLT